MRAAADSGRRRAREVAFRVVFQADVLGEAWTEAWAAARARERLSRDQTELVDDVLGLLARRQHDIDGELRAAAHHWEIERLAATDRAVLRIAVAEILGRPATPARVILDEAIDIAKRYGTTESGGFVNGVLDRVARRLRPGEL